MHFVSRTIMICVISQLVFIGAMWFPKKLDYCASHAADYTWVMENLRKGQKNRNVLSQTWSNFKEKFISWKWTSMALLSLAKFDQSHGHVSFKNKNYQLNISFHNQLFNSSRSFNSQLFSLNIKKLYFLKLCSLVL